MIDLKYILVEKDFLDLNLYMFEIEGRFRKITTTVLVVYLAIILAILATLIYYEVYVFAIIAAITSIVISLFHEKSMKKKYIKQFRTLVQIYSGRFNKEFELKINGKIFTRSIAGTSEFNLEQIKFVAETESHFFIKLFVEGIIIPKSKLTDIKLVKTQLSELTKKLNIEFKINESWKWS